MGRLDYTSKNIKFGYIGTFLNLIIKFVSRTIFIYTIGVTYLGVNGLYTNVLSVLSFAELGIGTAINYSLYKPVAEKNVERIKSLMYLYKKAYRLIAIVVTCVGLALVPFLNLIIKDPGNISSNELIIYYLIFLFNTVSTYFVAYKYSLVNAEQKNYIETNIRTITILIVTLFQIIVLLIFKSFMLYLIIAGLVELMQKVYVNRYLNKRYPYLLDKDVEELSKEEIAPIKKNVKALILHKFGDVSRHQTDNIIVSAFINITTVGIISNYLMIINSINSFICIIFNSVTSSLGNLIATENKQKQYEIYKIYRFMGFWIFGFTSVAFYTLLTPFVSIWLGNQMIVGNSIILLIIVDYYFKGHRIVINNFKLAAGIFDEDKYIAIIMAVVNLIVSVYLIQYIGLAGVYVGTLVSGLISNFTKPFIVYKKLFHKNVSEYYIDGIKFLFTVVMSQLVVSLLIGIFLNNMNIFSLILMMLIVGIVPNVIFYVIFRRREEYKYINKVIILKLRKFIRGDQL